MTNKTIYDLLSVSGANQRIVTRYISFIESCSSSDENEYTEIHHILPSSIFPEFKNLKSNKWNSKQLTSRQHFIAHCMLSRMFKQKSKEHYSMIKAFNMMVASSTNQRYMNSRLYEQNRKHMSDTMSSLQTGCNNSQFGTVWVTSPDMQNKKKVKIDLINEYYEQGWFISRSRVPFKAHKPERKVREEKPKPTQVKQPKPIKESRCLYCDHIKQNGKCFDWCESYKSSITAYKRPIVDNMGNIFQSMTDAARYNSVSVELIRLKIISGVFSHITKDHWWYYD